MVWYKGQESWLESDFTCGQQCRQKMTNIAWIRISSIWRLYRVRHYRSSHRRCSVRKVLFLDRKIHGKTPVPVSSLIKLQASACNFIKKRLWNRYFPVNIAWFLRTPFLQNTTERLLLILGWHLYSGRIFPHSDWIRRDTAYLYVFSVNDGKYGPE